MPNSIVRPALVALFALLAVVAGTYVARAASGPSSGFITLSNPETGEEVVAWCESGTMTDFAVTGRGGSYAAGAPLGAPCSEESLEGFKRVVNTHPFGGQWMIHPGSIENSGTVMAYTCTSRGAVFAIKNPGESLYVRRNPVAAAPVSYRDNHIYPAPSGTSRKDEGLAPTVRDFHVKNYFFARGSRVYR